MKKHTKIFSLFLSALMLCMIFTPISAMAASSANESESYVDIEIPLVRAVSSPLVGNGGKFNAFFNANQTTATTNITIFDWRNSSLPTDAKITKVEVSSIKTNVSGMTYYVQVGKGSTVNNFSWAPNMLWSSKVNTNHFNNQDPSGYWALSFYATRLITNTPDYGAGASVSSATLRVYFN